MKKGDENNFQGGQNYPKKHYFTKKAFSKFRIRKNNKQWGANMLRGVGHFSSKKE